MDLNLLWIIQLAPLAAFMVIMALPKSLKRVAPVVGVSFSFVAAYAAVNLLLSHPHGFNLPVEFNFEWLNISENPLWPNIKIFSYVLNVGFLADQVNILMITLVTTISVCVQIFSYYYMQADPSRPRYFAFLSFFSFAMTGLVLSNNLLQTFMFWELVGLASYLLIGFWFEKKSAGDAARKAFVINRLADLGFYAGIILLIIHMGSVNFLDFSVADLHMHFSTPMITLLGLLIFTGVMGKSAQFPFHVWLPDAMEGPTPVSALIHSATMVAAGVFLLIRAFPLFEASETTLQVILIIGSLTALTGAFLATVQRDIKKIMAYSTVSQLGFMVMAIGAGSTVAAMFHLSTHAYFKSLLFLTSGAFIHHFHSNDIWVIGKKGGKKDILALSALCLGLFSLCGIPPFSGFFSKDMILEVLKEHNIVFFSIAVLVSTLTAYYSFRLLFVILFSKIEKTSHSHGHTAHEDDHSHPSSRLLDICRAFPLIALALTSLYVGFLGTPMFGSAILHWLGGHAEEMHLEMLIITAVIIFTGVTFAFIGFKNPGEAEKRLESKAGPIKSLLLNKFYIDDAYAYFVNQIGLRFAGLMNRIDKKVFNQWMVDDSSWSIGAFGRLAARMQSGSLQNYISIALAVFAMLVLVLTIK